MKTISVYALSNLAYLSYGLETRATQFPEMSINTKNFWSTQLKETFTVTDKNYGCYCNFNGVSAPHGHPVDELDAACKLHYETYKCLSDQFGIYMQNLMPENILTNKFVPSNVNTGYITSMMMVKGNSMNVPDGFGGYLPFTENAAFDLEVRRWALQIFADPNLYDNIAAANAHMADILLFRTLKLLLPLSYHVGNQGDFFANYQNYNPDYLWDDSNIDQRDAVCGTVQSAGNAAAQVANSSSSSSSSESGSSSSSSGSGSSTASASSSCPSYAVGAAQQCCGTLITSVNDAELYPRFEIFNANSPNKMCCNGNVINPITDDTNGC